MIAILAVSLLLPAAIMAQSAGGDGYTELARGLFAFDPTALVRQGGSSMGGVPREFPDLTQLSITGWHESCTTQTPYQCEGSFTPLATPVPIDITGTTCYVNPNQPNQVLWYAPLPFANNDDGGVVYAWAYTLHLEGALQDQLPVCNGDGVCDCTNFEPLRAGWDTITSQADLRQYCGFPLTTCSYWNTMLYEPGECSVNFWVEVTLEGTLSRTCVGGFGLAGADSTAPEAPTSAPLGGGTTTDAPTPTSSEPPTGTATIGPTPDPAAATVAPTTAVSPGVTSSPTTASPSRATNNTVTNIEIDPWDILQDYKDQTAYVGDTVTFIWEGLHNVFIHPSGTCDEAGAVEISFSSPASYTFTEAGEVYFACDVGEHCEAGQIIKFTVSDQPDIVPPPAPATDAPTGSPSAAGTTDSPTALPAANTTDVPTALPTSAATEAPTRMPPPPPPATDAPSMAPPPPPAPATDSPTMATSEPPIMEPATSTESPTRTLQPTVTFMPTKTAMPTETAMPTQSSPASTAMLANVCIVAHMAGIMYYAWM